MEHYVSIALMLFVPALLSGLGCALIRPWAGRLGLVSARDIRRAGPGGIPMLGGLAVLLGLGGGFGIISVMGSLGDHPAHLVLSGILLVAGFALIGLLDDLLDLPPAMKLLAEFGVALLALLLPLHVEALTDSHVSVAWVSIASRAMVITGMANAFNMTDNSDGLAAGAGAISFLGLAGLLLPAGEGALALAAVGALAAFFVWNRPPARIYLGDLGSLPVGALLGLLLANDALSPNSTSLVGEAIPATHLPALVLILGYTLLDPVYTLWHRILRGARPWIGGLDHAAHDLQRLLGSWPSALALILGVQFFSAAVSLLQLRLSFPPLLMALGFFPWIVLLGAASCGARCRLIRSPDQGA